MVELEASRDTHRGVRLMLVAFLAAAVGASIQQQTLHTVNNFAIFRGAFYHLVAGRDLYASYPALYFDRFKYSPTFAFLIGPIAVLPMAVGLALWNLLNAGALWLMLARLFRPREALIAMLLVWAELLGSMQSAQSNALVTALVVFAYLSLEAGDTGRGAVAIAIGAATKIFPAAAVTLALLDPKRRRFAIAFALALLVLAALPLTVTGPSTLAAQYRSWWAIEQLDALAGTVPTDPHLLGGVMQQLRLWSPARWPNWPVQLAGTLVLILPLLLRPLHWSERSFRLRFLASLLIYMVIFNHQAESPTFVIAMTGIATWYLAVPRGRADTALLITALIFTSIATSDLTPHAIRNGIVRPYGVKAMPSIVIWLVLQAELWGVRRPRPPDSDLAEVRALDPSKSPADRR